MILKVIKNYLYNNYLPMNLSFLYQLGSILGFIYIIQIISGILLATLFSVDEAFMNIDRINREITYGYILRYTHSNGSFIIFFILYLHIFKSLFYSSYYKLHTYIIGIFIFLLSIITAFLGYTLPNGQMSLWGATVITNLLSVLPYGKNILEFIWGNYYITLECMKKFYSLHYLLPFILVGLMILHLYTLHQYYTSNPLNIRSNHIQFHIYYSIKDILGIILIIFLYIYFIFYNPLLLGHSDNYIISNLLVTPSHIVPELYLLPYYGILKSINSKIIGIIAMIISILLLIIIPLIQNRNLTNRSYRPLYYFILFFWLFNFISLGIIGTKLVVEPYITIGKYLVYMNFYFYPLIYILSLVELILF